MGGARCFEPFKSEILCKGAVVALGFWFHVLAAGPVSLHSSAFESLPLKLKVLRFIIEESEDKSKMAVWSPWCVSAQCERVYFLLPVSPHENVSAHG